MSKENSRSSFAWFFDRIAVIHTPDRTDRLAGIRRQLRLIGADPSDSNVWIGCAPPPTEALGFPSAGVRGCFLSHLTVLANAYEDGLSTVLVLEDDALFSRCLVESQGELTRALQCHPWDLCFFGHSLKLRRSSGMVRLPPDLGFTQAHCYAVNGSTMRPLIEFLRAVLERPEGHPLGGPMHLDGAYAMFRAQHPQIITVGASPSLCMQRGTPSALAERKAYDGWAMTRGIVAGLRGLRDRWRVRSVGRAEAFGDIQEWSGFLS